jgi:hypothetical protein
MGNEAEDLDLQTGETGSAAGGEDDDDDLLQGVEVVDGKVDRAAVIAMRRDLNEKLARLAEENEGLLDQNALYRANLRSGPARSPEKQATAADPYFEGRDDEDVVTVAEMKRILASERSMLSAGLSELAFGKTQADYETVIKKHLPNVLRTSPEMMDVINATHPSKRHITAYLIGQQDPKYRQGQAAAQLEKGAHEDARKIAANKGKPNLAAAKGAAGLSAAARYESMTDQELEAEIARVKGL